MANHQLVQSLTLNAFNMIVHSFYDIRREKSIAGTTTQSKLVLYHKKHSANMTGLSRYCSTFHEVSFLCKIHVMSAFLLSFKILNQIE